MDLHEKLRKGRPLQEDVSFRRDVERLSIGEVLEAVAKSLGTEPGALTRRRRGTHDRGLGARGRRVERELDALCAKGRG